MARSKQGLGDAVGPLHTAIRRDGHADLEDVAQADPFHPDDRRNLGAGVHDAHRNVR